MTTVVTHDVPGWTTGPGLGIFADLTPPELLNGRRLGRIRRALLAALAGSVALVGLGTGLAMWRQADATHQLTQQQSRITQLQGEQGKFTTVTHIQKATAAVDTQLAQLMGSDTDFTALLGSIHAAQPTTVSVSAEQVTVSAGGGPSAAGTGPAAPTGSLDTSLAPQIGKITLAGTVASLDDFAVYITHLQQVPGIVDVLPSTVAEGSSGGTTKAATVTYQFAVTMSVTNARLTHRFPTPAAPVVPLGPTAGGVGR